MANRFHRNITTWPDFIGFYWVLPGFTEWNRILVRCNGFDQDWLKKKEKRLLIGRRRRRPMKNERCRWPSTTLNQSNDGETTSKCQFTATAAAAVVVTSSPAGRPIKRGRRWLSSNGRAVLIVFPFFPLPLDWNQVFLAFLLRFLSFDRLETESGSALFILLGFTELL